MSVCAKSINKRVCKRGFIFKGNANPEGEKVAQIQCLIGGK